MIESRGVPNRLTQVYEMHLDGRRMGEGRVFYNAGAGTIDGNLWWGWSMGSDELDGVMVISPASKMIGRIALPERCATCVSAGAHATGFSWRVRNRSMPCM